MKLVVGLGNPGRKYAATRHNVGFRVVQQFAETAGIALKKSGHQAIYGVGRALGQELMVLLPQTYMNRSGVAVASACRAGRIEAGDVIVVHDDIDLCFGGLRVKVGGGHGGHNGLRSIVNLLGTREFMRVRVGVGRPSEAMDVADYVLRPFSAEERSRLDSVLENSVRALEVLLHQGAQQAMNEFNNRVF